MAWVPDAGAIAGLTGDWPCLSAQAGGFAERNSCRGPARTGLDVRLAARIAKLGGRPLALSVDVYNLVERVDGIRDSALLLVDPDGPISTSSDGGTLTVPLSVNPDFGKVLFPTGPGRLIRIGLRLGGVS